MPDHYEAYLQFPHQRRDARPAARSPKTVRPGGTQADWETDYKTVDEPFAVLLKETP